MGPIFKQQKCNLITIIDTYMGHIFKYLTIDMKFHGLCVGEIGWEGHGALPSRASQFLECRNGI